MTEQTATLELADSLERGYTLPADWYTDPAVFAREKDRIFRHAWQYVGLVEQLASPGDFVTYNAGDIPIVVVRDLDGELRAFVNVCRHRGSELVLEERGCKKSIQCHYHAWTYGLDGRLRSAPGIAAEPNFDKSQFSLVPVQVSTWGPFVFVNPDRDAPPLAAALGELPELVAATGLNLNGIRRRVRTTYDIAANWKVVVDNYLECYHCPVAHPGFADLIDLDDYQIDEYEYFSAQYGGLNEKARAGRGPQYGIEGDVESGFYAYLWPNFTVNIYPGPGNVSLNLFLPVDARHTRAIFEYCFVDSVSDDDVREFERFIDQVQREDTVLCESVQRGLQSGCFDQGKLLLTRESALRHFQKLVHRHVA